MLQGVDLAVEKGEIVAVLGSNGVGKSTLNRVISGVLRASEAPFASPGIWIEQENPARIVCAGLFTCRKGVAFFPI